MPDLPQIKALTPTVIPPVEAKLYDEWRMMELHVDAKDIHRSVECVVRLQKGRQLGGGEWEMSPTNEVQYLRYENLIDSATRDPGLGQVVFGLLAYVSAATAAQEQAMLEAEQRRQDEEAARIKAEQAAANEVN